MAYTHRDGRVVMVTPPATIDARVVSDLVGELERYLALGQPYTILFDLGGAGTPAAAERRRLAAHISENDAAIRTLVRGMALVSPSTLLRGAFTATLWLSPLPVPHRIFGDRDEALRWLRSLQ